MDEVPDQRNDRPSSLPLNNNNKTTTTTTTRRSRAKKAQRTRRVKLNSRSDQATNETADEMVTSHHSAPPTMTSSCDMQTTTATAREGRVSFDAEAYRRPSVLLAWLGGAVEGVYGAWQGAQRAARVTYSALRSHVVHGAGLVLLLLLLHLVTPSDITPTPSDVTPAPSDVTWFPGAVSSLMRTWCFSLLPVVMGGVAGDAAFTADSMTEAIVLHVNLVVIITLQQPATYWPNLALLLAMFRVLYWALCPWLESPFLRHFFLAPGYVVTLLLTLYNVAMVTADHMTHVGEQRTRY